MQRIAWVVLVLVVWTLGIGQTADGQPGKDSRAAKTGNPTSTRVWQGDAGAVSPDGRYLFFPDWDTGDLALHDLATNKRRIIVAAKNPKGNLKVYAEASSISHNGTQIAYSWYDESLDRYELWVADLRGDPKPRRLYGAPNVEWLAPHDWSPDGKSVAILLSTKDLTKQLAILSVKDGTMRPLKSGRWPSYPRAFFSPDGKYIAYDLPQDSMRANDVWVAAVDGTRDARVIAHRGNDAVMGWSPDGKHLIYTSERTSSTALFSVEIRDGVTHGVPLAIMPDMGSITSLGITGKGALFYVTQRGRRGGSIQVAEFNMESGNVDSPRDVSTGPQEENVNPTWSPDGRYLAYVSLRGRQAEIPIIVVRTADTGWLVREIQPKMLESQLAGWVPDSKALLVMGKDLNGRNGAFRIDAESGEVSLLFAIPYAPTLSMPTLSLDGRILYYWKNVNGGKEHVIIGHDLATGAEKEIIRRPFLGALLLSPDGRFLATATVDPTKNERLLLLVPLDGSTPREAMRIPSGVADKDLRQVEGKGSRVAPASWAPESQSFIARLLHEPDGTSELWRVSVSGEAPRKLSSMLEAHVFAFRISPDGRHVAYRIKEAEPELAKQVWKFEHFLPRENRK